MGFNSLEREKPRERNRGQFHLASLCVSFVLSFSSFFIQTCTQKNIGFWG